MTELEFKSLATQGYNRIPLIAEAFADLETPLSLYLKLADAPNSYLLESVQGGEKWGRYSIIGLPCRTVLRVQDGRIAEELGQEDAITAMLQLGLIRLPEQSGYAG